MMDAVDKAHEAKDLDLSGAARGVWLVKVSNGASVLVPPLTG